MQISKKNVKKIDEANNSKSHSKYLFVGSEDGSVQQYSISKHELVYNYGKIHQDQIWSISCTSDSKF